MDNNIRYLINVGIKENSSECIEKAFVFIKTQIDNRSQENPLSFSLDCFVLLAEAAIKVGKLEIARFCIEYYQTLDPPQNQFYGRAFIAQSFIERPDQYDEPEYLEKSIFFILKAVRFAKTNSKYHFIVYNASLAFYEISRHFLRPNYIQYLRKALNTLIKALEEIDDKDYEWRATLCILMLKSHIDAGNRKEIIQMADQIALFIGKHAFSQFREFLELMISNGFSTEKYAWHTKNDPELTIYLKFYKLKSQVNDKDVDLAAELQKMVKLLGGNALTGTDKGASNTDSTVGASSASLAAETTSSVSLNAASQNDSESGGGASANLELPSQSVGIASRRKSAHPVSLNARKLSLNKKNEILLQIARFSLDQGLAKVCKHAMNAIISLPNEENANFNFEFEFLKSDLLVRQLNKRCELMTQSMLDLHVMAVKRCHETLQSAVREAKPTVIQTGAATLWNLCLPLLQPRLRHTTQKSLRLIHECLESTNCSQFYRTHCQVLIELAKCDEDEEQIPEAIKSYEQALLLDDTKKFSEGIQMQIWKLKLRQENYKLPERNEDLACQLLEQIKSTMIPKSMAQATSGTRVKTNQAKSNLREISQIRTLLIKTGLALAPESFQLVLEAENGFQSDSKPGADGKKVMNLDIKDRVSQYDNGIVKSVGHIKRLGSTNDRERATIWSDLCKVSRYFEIWDVCRAACRFCLLYDDNRWKLALPPVKADSNIKRGKSRAAAQQPNVSTGTTVNDSGATNIGTANDTQATAGGTTTARATSPTNTSISQQQRPGLKPSHYEKSLLIMLAETHLIQAEAFVQFLRSEGGNIYISPIKQRDIRKKPKSFLQNDSDINSDAFLLESESDPSPNASIFVPRAEEGWNAYIDLLNRLSDLTLQSFCRVAEIGVNIGESWLVANSATYMWNCCQPLLQLSHHQLVVRPFSTILECMKKINLSELEQKDGQQSGVELSLQLAVVALHGTIQAFIPDPIQLNTLLNEITAVTASTSGSDTSKNGQLGGTAGAGKNKTPTSAGGKKKGQAGADRGNSPSKNKNFENLASSPPEVMERIKQTCELGQYYLNVAQGPSQIGVLQGLSQSSPPQTAVGASVMNQGQTGGSNLNTESGNVIIGGSTQLTNQINNLIESLLNQAQQSGIVKTPSIQNRLPLLQVIAQTKQLLQQNVGRNLGTGLDENHVPFSNSNSDMMDKELALTRACMAVELLWLNKNGSAFEFKDIPTYSEAKDLIENCDWKNNEAAKLETIAKLVLCLMDSGNFVTDHKLIVTLSNLALDNFSITDLKHLSQNERAITVSFCYEMLAYLAIYQGQSYLAVANGRLYFQKKAIELFCKAAKFGSLAKCYRLTIASARLFWSVCQMLIYQVVQRQSLRPLIQNVLEYISKTVDHKLVRLMFETHVEEGEENYELIDYVQNDRQLTIEGANTQNYNNPQSSSFTSSILSLNLMRRPLHGLFPSNVEQNPSESSLSADFSMRAAMYTAIFQSYLDLEQWELAESILDKAMNDLPRTKHRLEIFRNRIITKAKLGLSIEMDIQKFRSEPEHKRAKLWRLIALNSKEKKNQLSSYLQSIKILTLPENNWLKVDLLLEFSQWLYCNGFSEKQCSAQIDWAIDLIFNMKLTNSTESELNKNKKSLENRSSPHHSSKKGSMKTSKSVGGRGSSYSAKNPEKASKNQSPFEVDDETSSTAAEKILLPSLEQQTIIGVPDLTNDTNIKIKIIKYYNVRQLFSLISALTLKLKMRLDETYNMQTHHRHQKIGDLLMAVNCIHQIWRISMQNMPQIIKDLNKLKIELASKQKAGAAGPGKSAGKDAKSTAPGGGKETANKDKAKDNKPKRKTAIDWIPKSTTEWSTYECPDDVIEAWGSKKLMEFNGFHSKTIPNPTMTFNLLTDLCSLLSENHMIHFQMPILALQDALLKTDLFMTSSNSNFNVSSNQAMNFCIHLRFFKVCSELNLIDAAKFHSTFLGNFAIPTEHLCSVREMISSWKSEKDQNKKEGKKLHLSTKSNDESSSSNFQELSRAFVVDYSGGHLKRSFPGAKFQFEQIWQDTAALLIDMGYLIESKEYIDQVKHIAEKIKDNQALAKAYLLEIRLLTMKGQYNECLSVVNQMFSLELITQLDEYEFTQIVINSASSCIYNIDKSNGKKLARDLFKQACKSLKNSYRMSTVDVPIRKKRLNLLIAKLELEWIRLDRQYIWNKFSMDLLNSSETESALKLLIERLYSGSSLENDNEENIFASTEGSLNVFVENQEEELAAFAWLELSLIFGHLYKIYSNYSPLDFNSSQNQLDLRKGCLLDFFKLLWKCFADKKRAVNINFKFI